MSVSKMGVTDAGIRYILTSAVQRQNLESKLEFFYHPRYRQEIHYKWSWSNQTFAVDLEGLLSIIINKISQITFQATQIFAWQKLTYWFVIVLILVSEIPWGM